MTRFFFSLLLQWALSCCYKRKAKALLNSSAFLSILHPLESHLVNSNSADFLEEAYDLFGGL